MENTNIVIVKQHPRRISYSNPFYLNQCPDINDRIIIDITSRNKDKEFANQVSPFYVGPVVGPDGAKAETLEIFWQCGKVFPHHDDNGRPNKDYFIYRDNQYSKSVNELSKPEMRHPYHVFGYEAEDMLYWPLFDKEKGEYIPLSYLEARKKVYIPEYAKLVANSSAFAYMKKLVDEGKKIAILDFDGFNYYCNEAMKIRYRAYVHRCKKAKRPIEVTEEDFINIDEINEAIDFPYIPVGHGFIIKALLQGDLKVEGNKVIDVKGILN